MPDHVHIDFLSFPYFGSVIESLGLKEIQPVHPKGNCPGCSLQGLMLKLKLQYFGHLI